MTPAQRQAKQKRWPFVFSVTIQAGRVCDWRCGRTEWEVQETNDEGYLDWFSDAPYLTRHEAVSLGRKRALSAGHRLVVKNVATGAVAYRRSA